jgi:hypothetical protein
MNFRRFLPNTCEGYAAAFGAALLAIVLALLCTLSEADAGQVCRVKAVQRVQYHDPYVEKVYYKMALGVEQEAVATYQFRQSDEYIDYQQLLGERRGVDKVLAAIGQQVTDSGDRTAGPPQPASHPGHPAATEEGQTTEPPMVSPIEPGTAAYAFAARYPTLAAKCQRCHDKDDPPEGVFISPTVPLEGPDAASKRDAIARAIVNLRMPKGKPLDDQSQYNALVELFSEPTPTEGE